MRSPLRALPSSKTPPPTSISAALAIGPWGNGRLLLQTEPNAHEAAANRINAAPIGLACRLEPRLSMAIPTSPRTIPAHSRRVLRCPQNKPNTRVNNGTVATANAATPEATPACSASVTPPLPQLSNSTPITPAARHCGQVGAGTPRQRKKPYSSVPAITKRTPAISSGGQDSTPMRITR
ncbi:hypothetical protein D3C76_862680 [compost metagenome]